MTKLQRRPPEMEAWIQRAEMGLERHGQRWSLMEGGASRSHRGGGPESKGGAMSESGGADGLREPSEAEWLLVLAGDEGGRSQGDGSRWNGAF